MYLCTVKINDRDLAQLVAHTSGGREVAGSSPVIPTLINKRSTVCFRLSISCYFPVAVAFCRRFPNPYSLKTLLPFRRGRKHKTTSFGRNRHGGKHKMTSFGRNRHGGNRKMNSFGRNRHGGNRKMTSFGQNRHGGSHEMNSFNRFVHGRTHQMNSFDRVVHGRQPYLNINGWRVVRLP